MRKILLSNDCRWWVDTFGCFSHFSPSLHIVLSLLFVASLMIIFFFLIKNKIKPCDTCCYSSGGRNIYLEERLSLPRVISTHVSSPDWTETSNLLCHLFLFLVIQKKYYNYFFQLEIFNLRLNAKKLINKIKY